MRACARFNTSGDVVVAEKLAKNHCHAALLADRTALRVRGPDAARLLQGLITNDIAKARDGAAIHAGLLTPQGKILFDFFVVPGEEGFLLEVAAGQAADLMKRIVFYKLRAQAEVTEAPYSVSAVWGERPAALPEGAILYADPRLPTLGYRVLLPAAATLAALGCADASEAAYHSLRIRLGVPQGGLDYAYGDAFPHEALFDQLHGVDFKKGCYVGQEVVSRMEHRGTARKRVVPVEGTAALPSPGTSIEAGATALGNLGSVSGSHGLALMRLDRAEEALKAGIPLRAGEVTVTLDRPAWARFLAVPAGPA
ncbi:MAG: CAF17-like 4Fe-4S cluster assembly/insertion protein YgfZ [Methyloceanibacter sp.]